MSANTLKHFPAAILLVVGAINFYPLIGAVSAESFARLYEVDLRSVDLIILMRHRAVLFGLLGALMIAAAFRPVLRTLACCAGLVSMISFVWIALAIGDFGDALRKVILADICGSIGLLTVLAAGNRQPIR